MSTKTKVKKLFWSLMFTAILSLPLLASCNAMEGLGRDVRAAGEALGGAASKAKGY